MVEGTAISQAADQLACISFEAVGWGLAAAVGGLFLRCVGILTLVRR